MSVDLTPEMLDGIEATMREKPHSTFVSFDTVLALVAEVRKWQAAALRNYDDSTTMQQLKEATDYARDMEDRVRDLEATVARVRDLHRPRWISLPLPGGFICAECGEPVESEPCATQRALDGDA